MLDEVVEKELVSRAKTYAEDKEEGVRRDFARCILSLKERLDAANRVIDHQSVLLKAKEDKA